MKHDIELKYGKIFYPDPVTDKRKIPILLEHGNNGTIYKLIPYLDLTKVDHVTRILHLPCFRDCLLKVDKELLNRCKPETRWAYKNLGLCGIYHEVPKPMEAKFYDSFNSDDEYKRYFMNCRKPASDGMIDCVKVAKLIDIPWFERYFGVHIHLLKDTIAFNDEFYIISEESDEEEEEWGEVV